MDRTQLLEARRPRVVAGRRTPDIAALVQHLGARARAHAGTLSADAIDRRGRRLERLRETRRRD